MNGIGAGPKSGAATTMETMVREYLSYATGQAERLASELKGIADEQLRKEIGIRLAAFKQTVYRCEYALAEGDDMRACLILWQLLDKYDPGQTDDRWKTARQLRDRLIGDPIAEDAKLGTG